MRQWQDWQDTVGRLQNKLVRKPTRIESIYSIAVQRPKKVQYKKTNELQKKESGFTTFYEDKAGKQWA